MRIDIRNNKREIIYVGLEAFPEAGINSEYNEGKFVGHRILYISL